ncbi:primosomal protein N' [Beggiatoa alba]|nr:primosomal protein N' [Beggiatoa alba]
MQDSLFNQSHLLDSYQIIQVAVPKPIRQLFDYLVPKPLFANLKAGMRVKVPFARQQLVGIILSTHQHSPYARHKLKPVIEVIDEAPCLPDDMLDLLHWVGRYYQHPIGEVFSHALPALLRQGKPAQTVTESVWKLTKQGRNTETKSLGRAIKQRQILDFLKHASVNHPTAMHSATHLNLQWDNWRDAMHRLAEKGLTEQSQQAPLFTPDLAATAKPLHPLNTEQHQASEAIIAALGQHQVFLLEGITGSGKTEVYMQCIIEVLKRGQRVLVLVPEIGLTPQLLERFTRHLNTPIAVLHSSMNDTERLNNWLAVHNGHASSDTDSSAMVLIGTRSAVFTPIKNLGLILIDEEHDLSLKQQDGLRYSARDVAIMRAHRANLPIVLGSATPSLETLYNVQQERYIRLKLKQRAGNAKLPDIHLLDVRGQKLEHGLSAQLIERIREHLQHGNQVLLFLNRRGFAPVMMCYECGWLSHCPRCDAYFTLHQKARRLRCHHCGSEQAIPHQCPDCKANGLHNELNPVGMGTERVEEALAELFPEHTVLRIDRDSTRKKGELENRLLQAKDGQSDILLGTQMLAKGHHFPRVTLVGILSADQGFYSADFRASERMGQLILQVAGRAGREKQRGEVLIQTDHPDNPLLLDLKHHSYPLFCKNLLNERAQALLPPFSYHVLIRAEAPEEIAPIDFLQAAKQSSQSMDTEMLKRIEIFGPFPAPMTRRAGRFRYQMLCQAHKRNDLQQLLHSWLPLIEKLPNRQKVRWSVDVDPQEMY